MTRTTSRRERINWTAVRGVVAKDLRAVVRSKSVIIPMLAVPTLLMVLLPAGIGFAARTSGGVRMDRFLNDVPGDLARPILDLPVNEQLIVLVNGYLLAPLFLIVPLMVSAVLAADAFAGEKERRTLESLLHSSISERELFIAKFLSAFLPAVAVSWVGFAAFVTVANTVAWPVMQRIFVPTQLWGVMIVWVAPAVATLGLSVMVRVSARTETAQEANQLGGAVILPLIFLAVGQSTGLLLVTLPIAFFIGLVIWVIALALLRGGIKRFTRDALISQVRPLVLGSWLLGKEHELDHGGADDQQQEQPEDDGRARSHVGSCPGRRPSVTCVVTPPPSPLVSWSSSRRWRRTSLWMSRPSSARADRRSRAMDISP